MGIEENGQEGPEQERQEVIWYEEKWVEGRFRSLHAKSPALAKFATMLMDATYWGLREASAEGPKTQATTGSLNNYDNPKPYLGTMLGPLGGMFVAVNKFFKGGETFEVLKKKYGLK